MPSALSRFSSSRAVASALASRTCASLISTKCSRSHLPRRVVSAAAGVSSPTNSTIHAQKVLWGLLLAPPAIIAAPQGRWRVHLLLFGSYRAHRGTEATLSPAVLLRGHGHPIMPPRPIPVAPRSETIVRIPG